MIGILTAVLFSFGSLVSQAWANSETLTNDFYQTDYADTTNRFFGADLFYQKRCVVADPTDTLLNIRATPNGKVIGTIKNDTVVYVDIYSDDAENRSWSQIKMTRR